jgi:hypothetical protein
MILLGETEAGNAGMQPRRGIAWWCYRNEVRRRERHLLVLPEIYIGLVDLDLLKIPARRAEYSLTESALPPFQAEPTHSGHSQLESHLCEARYSGPNHTNEARERATEVPSGRNYGYVLLWAQGEGIS